MYTRNINIISNYRILKELKQLTIENLCERRILLMSLLITCCDLSDQIKPWPTTLNVAVNKF